MYFIFRFSALSFVFFKVGVLFLLFLTIKGRLHPLVRKGDAIEGVGASAFIIVGVLSVTLLVITLLLGKGEEGNSKGGLVVKATSMSLLEGDGEEGKDSLLSTLVFILVLHTLSLAGIKTGSNIERSFPRFSSHFPLSLLQSSFLFFALFLDGKDKEHILCSCQDTY